MLELDIILKKLTKLETISHYTSKSNFVQSNLDTLQKTIERKQDNVQSVIQVLQIKMQDAQQQQQQQQQVGKA
uniref:Uncharacterized protein n=1 Tax=Kwoniella pini CBS 10737 TaxID=1296096 RepID=A0A1B9IBK7_9TREE|nr:uncharacterized protein I206_00336 [Kwoniella pini CBS 10737]OCF53035.1 hypothetical protein I206_00336 [Kwoniella pini CBS 10737]